MTGLISKVAQWHCSRGKEPVSRDHGCWALCTNIFTVSFSQSQIFVPIPSWKVTSSVKPDEDLLVDLQNRSRDGTYLTTTTRRKRSTASWSWPQAFLWQFLPSLCLLVKWLLRHWRFLPSLHLEAKWLPSHYTLRIAWDLPIAGATMFSVTSLQS